MEPGRAKYEQIIVQLNFPLEVWITDEGHSSELIKFIGTVQINVLEPFYPSAWCSRAQTRCQVLANLQIFYMQSIHCVLFWAVKE